MPRLEQEGFNGRPVARRKGEDVRGILYDTMMIMAGYGCSSINWYEEPRYPSTLRLQYCWIEREGIKEGALLVCIKHIAVP